MIKKGVGNINEKEYWKNGGRFRIKKMGGGGKLMEHKNNGTMEGGV